MLSLRSCLVDAKRILFFMDEQIFLPIGKLCSMQIHNVQWGERGGQRTEKSILVQIFLVLP